MALIERKFHTKAEAQAFLDGVEYVNDSSISIMGIKYRREIDRYVITFEDEDILDCQEEESA